MTNLEVNELPKVIDYITKDYLENRTFDGKGREAMELAVKYLKQDYVDWVYEERKDDQEFNLTKWFEDKHPPVNCNNWENLEKYDEYCWEQFKQEWASEEAGCSSEYERIKRAKELNCI